MGDCGLEKHGWHCLCRNRRQGRVFYEIHSGKVNQVEVLLELVAFCTDLNLNLIRN
jgi:hypothetical protein